MRILVYIALALLIPWQAHAAEAKEVQRVLLSLYSSKDSPNPRTSWAHQYLEMPANHLGFHLRFVDVEKPFPPLSQDDGVRGVVIWLTPGRYVPDGEAYLDWLNHAVSLGKKLMIFDDMGLSYDYRKREGAMDKLNNLLAHIGLRDLNSYNSVTYQGSILYQDDALVGFERTLPEPLPPYQETTVIPGIGTSHLKVLASKAPETIHDLIVTGPAGGYVASGYSIFEGYPILPIKDIEIQKDIPEEEREMPDPVQQWYINPFLFLRLVLHDENEPKPDVTTLNGLRIFYSHIDGDGWNNLTQIRRYAGEKMIAAEVIRRDVLAAYPDIPVNVSVITSEMDGECYGLHDSIRVAEDIFALPHIEASSHTHSHPLFWNYFSTYDPAKEMLILDKYPPRPKRRTLYKMLFEKDKASSWDKYTKARSAEGGASGFEKLLNKQGRVDLYQNHYYETPRSYACAPFDLNDEIAGSVERIRKKLPEDKRDKVRLVQWSGDTSPYEEVLRVTREAGLLNINGGDSRYDSEYPSYASVSPIGLQMGNERQIYSSNSNENTYTNLWTDRFFGFVYLQTTVENTEKPMRVQPFNIYYHMYSGEKQASLAALISNIEYARAQDLSRIHASDFAAIAEGYYRTRLIPQGEGVWSIRDRGKLNTVRVDKATLKTVDFDHSKGVMGFSYMQGNLYVTLDPDVAEPQVAIKEKKSAAIYDTAKNPYLIRGSWLTKGLISVKKSLMFAAQGYGKGKYTLKFPLAEGNYEVVVTRDGDELLRQDAATNSEGIMRLELAVDASEPVSVTIAPKALQE